MTICGIIFVVLGIAFLLTNLEIITWNAFNIIVALLFILIGLKCFYKGKHGHHWCCGEKHEQKE